MENALVSVIIPTRNRAAYLNHAIASVYAQSYKNFEIIVIDDGSQDNTKDIVRTFDQRLSYLFQKHAGVSAARNHGIQEARGEYIALLDDDDLYAPQKLQRNIEYFSRHPEVIWLCSGFGFINAEGTLLPRAPIIPEKEEVTLHDIALFAFIHTSSVIVRKRCFEIVGGFPKGSKVSEDYHMWAKLLTHGKGAALKECLTFFRQHKGNTKLPCHALLKENACIIDYIIGTHALGLAEKETYIKNLHRIVGDSLLYRRAFLQYVWFRLWCKLGTH